MTDGDSIRLPQLLNDGGAVALTGDWTLRSLQPVLKQMRRQLADASGAAHWDLTRIGRLDNFGAQLLWRYWRAERPERLDVSEAIDRTLSRVAALGGVEPTPRRGSLLDPIAAIGAVGIGLARHVIEFIALLGQLAIDFGYLLFRPGLWPLREISANLYKTGVRAMPVTALVGFLIGVVLSYLSALQLKAFGADIFIVNILGMGIIRELGPVLVAVLVAGRSGSAMTAQLGVMRVTEEIDALATMGVSRSMRLVFPKVAALAIAMPLLVLWTSAIALMGGMASAQVQLDISYGFFIETLPKVVPVANLYIALAKGVTFGIMVALVACHFGLRVRPNTESLSSNTTASVVSSITVVILVDAVFAIATRSIGLPT